MAVLERLSFLQKLPILIRSTSDDETPCPGYAFEEIAKISHESVGSHQCLLEYLLNRLQSQSCHVKLKVLKILLYLCAHGSSLFLQELRRNATFIQEATVFSGPPDPLHGNSLYQKVRAKAQDLASTLFTDALAPQPLLPPRPHTPTGMGSRCHAAGSLQGFGYTQESVGSGDLLLSTIQKIAGVVSSAVHPGPDLSRKPDDVYQPVTVPHYNVKHSVVHALPTVSNHRREASRQPGLAGGGWEESDSSNSSQQSSMENCGSGKTSGSGSDSHSGASREAGDLTERVECVHLSDCRQEASLVEAVTQGTKVFLSRDEVQHFVKECALLNCEAVVEFLNRKLQDPSTSIQMRSMSAISSLMCSDLLSHDHVFCVTRPHLQKLSEGSPGPVANRATKILRQFEAMARSKAPSNTLHLEGMGPKQCGGDLLADSTSFPMGGTVLDLIGLSPAGEGITEEGDGHEQCGRVDLMPATRAHMKAMAMDLQLTPGQPKEPAHKSRLCSSDGLTPNGDLALEVVYTPAVTAAAPANTSLFSGMDIVPSSSANLHHMDTRVLCSATKSVASSTVQRVPDQPGAIADANFSQHKGSSAFSFLNI